MKLSTFLNQTKAGFVVKNLFAALVVVLIALFVLLAWLKRYTEHGIEIEVPNITGMYLEEARMAVESNGLHIEVIDSTFSRKVPLGTIVEQNPVAESHSKHGRTIYVIINSQTVRQIPLPDLHDISYRQAEATLKSLGINVADYEYEPSEYKDLVLDVRQNDRTVAPGERLDEGSSVVLVVGCGKGTEKVTVPQLCGKHLQEARSLLLSMYLTLGIYEYDENPTPETADLYVVYKQEPTAGTVIVEGSHVNLYLSKDIEKAIVVSEDGNDEDFF